MARTNDKGEREVLDDKGRGRASDVVSAIEFIVDRKAGVGPLAAPQNERLNRPSV